MQKNNDFTVIMELRTRIDAYNTCIEEIKSLKLDAESELWEIQLKTTERREN